MDIEASLQTVGYYKITASKGKWTEAKKQEVIE